LERAAGWTLQGLAGFLERRATFLWRLSGGLRQARLTRVKPVDWGAFQPSDPHERMVHPNTPPPHSALPADFVRELALEQASMDVEARYKRCAARWEGHLQRTRSVILRAARMANNRRKAVVFGAGLLHDIPLAELSGLYQEVVLVDVVHSRSCQTRASLFTNVRCLQADVTGSAWHLVEARKTRAPLQQIEPILFEGDADVGLTVSVNLLSQLGCAPGAYLAATHAPHEIRAFQRHLVESHLQYLRRCGGHSALITDVAWSSIPVKRAGAAPAKRRELLHRVPLPEPVETWDWDIAPAPESDPHHDLVAHVAAYPDWKEAGRIRIH
jgi:hypothetical protein